MTEKQAGRGWGWEGPEDPSWQGYSCAVCRYGRTCWWFLVAAARNKRGVGEPGCRGRQSSFCPEGDEMCSVGQDSVRTGTITR